MSAKKQKYYKVLTKDLKAPNNPKFSYRWWRIKSFKVKGLLKMCRNGLHLYTSLKNVSIGMFGERIFEAKSVGEYISDENKICCREIKLIKELKPEDVKDSRWAYQYCCYIEDKSEIYKNIVESEWAYWYCYNIEDRLEVYEHITDPKWAYYYCCNIKNRPLVYKYITDSEWAYYYCRDIEDRSEVYKYITNPKWAYWYCQNIKDRSEVYKNITGSKWAKYYCFYIKNRPQICKS